METRTHFNHTITLNERDWTFTVSGPEFSDDKYSINFQSLKAAKDEIEKRHNESAAIAAKNTVLNLNVLDANGRACTITKINRNNAEVIGVLTTYFYPNVPWLEEALTRQAKLRIELKSIEERIRRFQINKTVTFGRISPDNYLRIVSALTEELASKTTEAKEAAKLQLTNVSA